MDTQALLRELGERLGGSASVRNVYGEPVTAGGRTVLPVARIHYAFGGGGGTGSATREGSGGGGGGVVRAWPAGALEVTPHGTRFVGFHDVRVLAVAAALGFMAGAALSFAGGAGLWATAKWRKPRAQSLPTAR